MRRALLEDSEHRSSRCSLLADDNSNLTGVRELYLLGVNKLYKINCKQKNLYISPRSFSTECARKTWVRFCERRPNPLDELSSAIFLAVMHGIIAESPVFLEIRASLELFVKHPCEGMRTIPENFSPSARRTSSPRIPNLGTNCFFPYTQMSLILRRGKLRLAPPIREQLGEWCTCELQVCGFLRARTSAYMHRGAQLSSQAAGSTAHQV